LSLLQLAAALPHLHHLLQQLLRHLAHLAQQQRLVV
jgi:hypothetical protein